MESAEQHIICSA